MTRTLWDALKEVPDQRGRKGRQIGLPSILALSVAAMLSGADSADTAGEQPGQEEARTMEVIERGCGVRVSEGTRDLDLTALHSLCGNNA